MKSGRSARSIQHIMSLVTCVLVLGQTAFAGNYSGVTAVSSAAAEIVNPVSIGSSNHDAVQSISRNVETAYVDVSSLKIIGNSKSSYEVSLPTEATVVASDGTGEEIRLTNFTSKATGTGSQSVMIGATALVGDTKASGVYVGTYPVIVNYN